MQKESSDYLKLQNILKFIAVSFAGIFVFFVPITINGTTSIPVELVVSYIMDNYMPLARIYALIFIILGTILPFTRGVWKKDKTTMVFSFFKIFGAFASILIFFNIGPDAILDPNVGPFLYDSLGVNLALLIPICAIFIVFLLGYGFVDFLGTLIRPITRFVWKTPGMSAVDALGSFVGSSATGIMITSGLYKEKKYSVKEASIIVTGFSAVAVTFMVVVAQTLDLMDYWGIFFGVAVFVTFAVTAVTVRLKPLRTKPDTYYNDEEGILEEEFEGNLLKNAFYEGLKVCSEAPPVKEGIGGYLKDAMELVLEYLPSLMSIGLAGLLLAEYTPFFNFMGYIFYPLTLLLRIPEPLLAAKATSMGLAEMYLPVLVVTSAPLITRFVVGIGSITGILMLSCTIPLTLATGIPIDIKELVIIWFERAIISLIIVAPIAHFIF